MFFNTYGVFLEKNAYICDCIIGTDKNRYMKKTRISDLLALAPQGQSVSVKGWVRTKRGNKNVAFIALNDGSTINNIQIVVDMASADEEILKDVTTGACVCIEGRLVESVGSGQPVEVQADKIEIYGKADSTYPLQKKGHSMEFLREIAYLRPRTNTFGAVATPWPMLSTNSSTTRVFIIGTHL